jgi:hypothetical protein
VARFDEEEDGRRHGKGKGKMKSKEGRKRSRIGKEAARNTNEGTKV